MFKLRTYCNDGDCQYWEDCPETYETYDKALLMCYQNALQETQHLMETSDYNNWFEVNKNFEITEVYENEALKDVVFFPVAAIRYDKAPWDRENDCDIEIITGYDIVEIKDDLIMISRLCYELYKVDWKHSHMITPEREMDSITNYYAGLVDNETEYTYNDYLEEFGYDGELYVCYEEFCDTEYRDKKYMCSLLGNEGLIAMYYKDVEAKG